MDNIELKLKKIEQLVEHELPSRFKILYRMQDGGKINNFTFLSLNEIINELSIVEEDFDVEEIIEVQPLQTILKKFYTSGRLPFMTDGSGNFIGIDFNPDINGIEGQVINYGRDELKMYVFANTFEDFINGIFSISNY